MKILITGFEPFGGAAVNPSWEAVKLLPEQIGGAALIRALLPVEYGTAGKRAAAMAMELGADLLICTGVAGGRTAVTPELLAANWRMASIADNAGVLYTGQKIDTAAPAAIMTTLPVTAMVEAVKQNGLPCALSMSAGGYVCNDVYWHILQGQAEGGYKALFIHVPLLEQSTAENTAKAIEICLNAAVQAISTKR